MSFRFPQSCLLFMASSLIFFAGCQPNRAPVPLPVPNATFSQGYFKGSTLSGVTPVVATTLPSVDELHSLVQKRNTLEGQARDVDAALNLVKQLQARGEVIPQVKAMVDDDRDVLNAEELVQQIGLLVPPPSASQEQLCKKRLAELRTEKTASYTQEYVWAITTKKSELYRDLQTLDQSLLKRVDAKSVVVTFLALEQIPATSFTPVGSRAIFFSSSRAAGAILPAAQLTRNATIAGLNDPADVLALLRRGHAGGVTVMKTMTGALPAGVTGQFTVLDTPEIHDLVTGTIRHRSVQVAVSRPANSDAPQLSLVMKDLVPRDTTHLELLTETAIFNLPQTDQTTTLLVMPFQFQASIARGLAILVHVTSGSTDAEHLAATTQCIEQLAKSSTTQPAITTGSASDWAAVSSAIQSLTLAKGRRESLAFLAAQTGGSICEDLAMEADDATLDQLVKKIQTSVSDDPNIEPNVGWILDHAALTLLDKLATDSANGTKVPTELLAILTNHTGEVGRHPSSLDEVLKGLTNRKDLDNRLLAQNMIYLEDSSPASRVRAYDWLSARHLAPQGYDPLATGKARRAALEKALGD